MKKLAKFFVLFVERKTGLFWFLIALGFIWASYMVKDEQTSALLLGGFILTIITSFVYFIEWIADLWDELSDWVNK